MKITRPFNVHYIIESPVYSKVNGVDSKEYRPVEDPDVFCSVRSFGGTEKIENGVLAVIDTKVVITYYRPDIDASCRLLDDSREYWQIITPPENIQERGRFIMFKIKKVKGGV